MYIMKSTQININDNLIYVGNGYKPQNKHSWGPGVRDIYALHYVLSGIGYLQSNNVIYTLKANESFIVFPDVKVHYYPDDNNPWEYIWIDFKGDEALRLLSMTNFTPNNPVAPEFPQNMEPLFHIIETATVKPFERERSNARLRLLLSYYMEYYPKVKTLPKTDYVLLAKEYIENNYWKASLTVLDIVNFVNIERTYLFRLFKKATGLSLLNYLTSYRIRRACFLLKSSELSIKAVAYSVGYEDQLYFSKIFKKATSYSPSDYRKQ